MERDPVTDAYAWGLEQARRPKGFDQERFERLRTMSGEEQRAAVRGLRDGGPAIAPLPLPFVLVTHLAPAVLQGAVRDRDRRWYDFVLFPGALIGFVRLHIEAVERYGPARARAAGIVCRGDAPHVPQERTNMWMLLMLLVMVVRRLAGYPPRKRTASEMAGASLARELVAWWAWRPYLRRRRAAPPA